MKNKAFKKTLLDVGGDDTREDIRDLMNESDMSLNGFDFKEHCEGQQSSSPVVTATKAPEKAPDTPVGKKMSRAMTKSLSMVTMKTNETTDKFMKKTKSLRALRGKRKHSNEENIDKSTTPPPSAIEEKRPKIDDVKEPLEEAATTKDPNLPASSISIQETALAKFAGVKNMLSSAVWGVPYAKVVEDPLEISVMDEPEVAKNPESPTEQNTSQAAVSEDNPANCIIA